MGPALILLLLFVILPLIVVVFVGIAWSCGWYLNQICCKAAAIAGDVNGDGNVTATDMDINMQPQLNAWNDSGLRAFVRGTVLDNRAVRFRSPPGPGLPNFVRVTTTIQMEPCFNIEVFAMNGWTFTYNAERPVEDFGQL